MKRMVHRCLMAFVVGASFVAGAVVAQERTFIEPAHTIGMVDATTRIKLAETPTACLFIVEHTGKVPTYAMATTKKANPAEKCE